MKSVHFLHVLIVGYRLSGVFLNFIVAINYKSSDTNNNYKVLHIKTIFCIGQKCVEDWNCSRSMSDGCCIDSLAGEAQENQSSQHRKRGCPRYRLSNWNEPRVPLWEKSFLHSIECFDKECSFPFCEDLKFSFENKVIHNWLKCNLLLVKG